VESLEDALIDFGGSILAISHDRYFLDRICTRTLTMESGVIRDYPGAYSWVQENLDKGTPLTRSMPARVLAGESGKGAGKRRRT
jgi:ATPase subunit of ABC transporter with duplicated ATPase domains